MPGKHITQQQEIIYLKNPQLDHSKETSPAKADISPRSGRRISNWT